jgi:hypothetical protein
MGGKWMMGKFATARELTLLLILGFAPIGLFGALASAQGSPAGQTPAAAPTTPATNVQQPSSKTPDAQQPAQEEEQSVEEGIARRKKAHDYKNWNFNLGAGANVDSGATKSFVRGGGVGGTFGVARNASKYFGLRADAFYEDLPLKQTSLALASAPSATSYLLAATLGPIINVPVSSNFGGYVLFGAGFYHRGGSLNSDTTLPGSGCTPFWTWWQGTCFNGSLPLNGKFVDTSQNQYGYEIGAGVTRKMPSGVEIYAEFRLMHGSKNGTTTDVRPITVGVRW